MKGIIEEGDEHAGEDYEDDDLRDAVIIGSAQRVEHYEIAAYGTAIAHARLLEKDEVVSLLEESLEEEKAADTRLTEIAESAVNLEAATEDDENMEEAPVRRRSSSSQRSMAMAAPRRNQRNGRTRGRSR
jgi:ferritin-like metal-binding protein YciE